MRQSFFGDIWQELRQLTTLYLLPAATRITGRQANLVPDEYHKYPTQSQVLTIQLISSPPSTAWLIKSLDRSLSSSSSSSSHLIVIRQLTAKYILLILDRSRSSCNQLLISRIITDWLQEIKSHRKLFAKTASQVHSAAFDCMCERVLLTSRWSLPTIR